MLFTCRSAWLGDNPGMKVPALRRPLALSRLAASLAAALLIGVALGVAPARADDDDHERARRAVESGQILPLRDVLARLERSYPGRVLEVELERDDGLWLYEIKLLQADGRLLKLKLDARTAAVLKAKR